MSATKSHQRSQSQRELPAHFWLRFCQRLKRVSSTKLSPYIQYYRYWRLECWFMCQTFELHTVTPWHGSSLSPLFQVWPLSFYHDFSVNIEIKVFSAGTPDLTQNVTPEPKRRLGQIFFSKTAQYIEKKWLVVYPGYNSPIYYECQTQSAF